MDRRGPLHSIKSAAAAAAAAAASVAALDAAAAGATVRYLRCRQQLHRPSWYPSSRGCYLDQSSDFACRSQHRFLAITVILTSASIGRFPQQQHCEVITRRSVG